MTTTERSAVVVPSPLAFALAYARRGWPVFPLHSVDPSGQCSCGRACRNAGKHPDATLAPNGFKNATTDPDIIRAWWRQHPHANIAIVTGRASNLLVVDIDPRSGGEATWSALCTSQPLGPLTVNVRTGGGGSHIYYARPDTQDSIKSAQAALGPGVDIKCDGGYVVAPPSSHSSGDTYAFRAGAQPGDADIQPMPDWLAGRIQISRRKRAPSQATTTSPESWLVTAFAAAGMLGRQLEPGKYAVTCPWSASHTTGTNGDSSTVILPVTPDHPNAHFACSHDHCKHRTIADVRSALPPAAVSAADSAFPAPAPPASIPASIPAPNAPDSDANWQAQLLRDDRGRIKPLHANVVSTLKHDPRWRDILAWNAFSDNIEIRKPPPWYSDDANPVSAHDWRDEDTTRLCCWFQRNSGTNVPAVVARSAVVVAAKCHTYHPVVDYLQSLRWDATPRISTWLTDYLGAAQTPYSRAVGRRFLIQLVARVMSPGCRADCVLILEGPQGARKSTALGILASDPWFADDVGDLASKDSADALRGKWLIELGELPRYLRRSDRDTFKHFLSRRFDHYRPAYAERTIDRPRQNVFAASTNDLVYVTDETGARRNWAVLVGRINTDKLARDRDLLFAEALAAYESGEQWWLAEAEESDQIEEQEKRRSEDPWTEPIRAWIDRTHSASITTDSILGGALDIEIQRREPQHAKRVGAVMRLLGYSRVRRRVGGQRCYVYLPHAEAAALVDE